MNAHRLTTPSLLFTAALAAFAAQSANAGTPPSQDSAALERARVAAAKNPLGAALLERTRRDAASLGYAKADSFELVRAYRDEDGRVHARLQQVHDGVPVYRSRLIAHDVPSSRMADRYVDRGVKIDGTPSTPRLSADDAIRLASGDARHEGDFLAPPNATLVYLPVRELVRKDGRAAVEGDDENRDDYVRKVVRTPLAWRVTGVEADRSGGPGRAREWFVDAHDGSVIASGELDHHSTGSGKGAWTNGTVSFTTLSAGCGFQMHDTARSFTTETDDFDSDEPVNCDSNNTWGDGLAFAGNSGASIANWQSAMVDGHFGATVYWDMMSNVWGFQGPDDDFYSVNVFMHDGTGWNNAAYHSLSGNVSFGDGTDGKNRTRLDCLGHELGHAWNDHNSDYGTSGLNESLGDIFGEWTDAYLASGGFAAHATSLGTNSNADWVNRCSGRNLVNPGNKYWSASLEDGEEHAAADPANRAFAFYARGSGANLSDSTYSRKLPWGMTGIGLQEAARTFLRAHRDRIAGGDYADLRNAMVAEARSRYGVDSSAERAARNAYAGIGVGSVASSYPALPPTTVENSGFNNNTWDFATYLGWGTAPPSGAVRGAPNKLILTGTIPSGDTDWFSVSLSGPTMRIRITPVATGGLSVPVVPLNVAILTTTTSPAVLAQGTSSVASQLVQFTASPAPTSAYTRFIRVTRASGGSSAAYRLEVDLSK